MSENARLTTWLLLTLVPASTVLGDFFVSSSGDDSAPGTRERPFRSLVRARDAVRELRAAEKLPAGGLTVWIHGKLHLDAPLELAREDSGTREAPIVYRGVRGSGATLSGGRIVRGFRPVAAPAVLDRLPEQARGHVVFADLHESGITDFGEVTARGRRLEVFFDDRPMQLARWPNEGFVRIVEVEYTKPFTSHGRRGTREGKFTYAEERPARWVGEADPWLHGYWFWDWSDSYERVASIDPARKRIETKPPYHGYGYRKGQRYYALNLLSEIDMPGEWYLDREAGRLYFWPPERAEEDSAAETVVTVLPQLVRFDDVSWVTLQGLTLEATRSTLVTIRGGEKVTVRGCRLRNASSWGVRIDGGRAHSVRSSDLHDLGEGGVSLRGGDRATLEPSGHEAVNNHVWRFGRLYRTYRPAFGVGGVGQRVAGNHIHDGPHNAIQLGGNEHVIELNEIHHVCYETGDVGAFYMGRDWTERGTIIRHNFFHHIEGPGLYGAMAVYLDDAASGITVTGNLFYRSGRSAFIGGGRDNLVENNIFVDCTPSVHVDARGMGWMRDHIEETMPERLRAMPYRSEPWRSRYPQLLTLLDDDPGQPKGNIVRRNISLGGRWLDIEEKARPLVRFEQNLIDEDPHFAGDPRAENATALDYRLGKDSPAWALGFEPIPVERIGLHDDDDRRALAGVERPE